MLRHDVFTLLCPLFLQDLPRTFPRHPWLSGPEGQTALRDVLTAYAGHNPDVGYCQVRQQQPSSTQAKVLQLLTYVINTSCFLGSISIDVYRSVGSGSVFLCNCVLLSSGTDACCCCFLFVWVQGMNFLVALLLLAVDYDCFRAFWLTVVLLEQVVEVQGLIVPHA